MACQSIRRRPLVLFITAAVTLKPIRSYTQAGMLQHQLAELVVEFDWPCRYENRRSFYGLHLCKKQPALRGGWEAGSPWCLAVRASTAAQWPQGPCATAAVCPAQAQAASGLTTCSADN